MPDWVMVSIMGALRKRTAQRAACVCIEWHNSVQKAKDQGMYDVKLHVVAAGGHATVVCSFEGELFTFGDNWKGMLGHHRGQKKERVPRLVKALAGKKVVGAAAGSNHMAVWTEAGELFTCGCGGAGKLGHGGEDNERVPKLVEALAGIEVASATVSFSHSAVWTKGGELFTFGNGKKGRLGHGGGENERVPRLVQALAGKKVVGAAAGYNHTAVWTKGGELFTFGNGKQGRLGHGGWNDEPVPRLVQALAGKKVIGAAAGANHMAVWTEAGELFTFGCGRWGKLGHGRGENDWCVPKLVEVLAGKDVIGATAGDHHIAVWTEAGELFTFGCGRRGVLGHGGQEDELVPKLVKALEGKDVIGATGGDTHTAAWTEAGELFTFGNGENGELGHGGKNDEAVPRLVEALVGKVG